MKGTTQRRKRKNSAFILNCFLNQVKLRAAKNLHRDKKDMEQGYTRSRRKNFLTLKNRWQRRAKKTFISAWLTSQGFMFWGVRKEPKDHDADKRLLCEAQNGKQLGEDEPVSTCKTSTGWLLCRLTSIFWNESVAWCAGGATNRLINDCSIYCQMV